MDNEEVAAILEEISIYLHLNGENPYKTRAYENAARTLQNLKTPLTELYSPQKKALTLKMRGIGTKLEETIVEILQNQSSSLLEELKAQTPAGLMDMLKISGLGAKKVYQLYKQLNIMTLHDLKQAAEKNKIRGLEGFGPKSEKNILEGLALLHSSQNRFYYKDAYHRARDYIAYLTQAVPTSEMAIAGSLRRKKEIIGDIDILSCRMSQKIMDLFTSYPRVQTILSQGKTKSSVILQDGIQVDLRLVDKKSFPYALNYFTGSKEHNIRLRNIAQKLGFTLNEYGLFDSNSHSLLCKDEKDIYKRLGLYYIPPELREDMGEIEHFQKNSTIHLVDRKDICGLVHFHTTMSDGRIPLEETIRLAISEGYTYLGLSDHSQTAYYAGGLTVTKLREQWAVIETLQKKYPGICLLRGIESDILADGNLDYSDDILEQFDFVIASVHSHFKMERTEMTNRIIQAIHNPYTTILGHPTGRLLLQRAPYQVDMWRILKACKQTGTWIEINSQPKRMDLDWREVKKAVNMNIKLVITPDGHDADMFEHMEYGINVARKGWCSPENIINTLSAQEFLQECQKLRKQKKTLKK